MKADEFFDEGDEGAEPIQSRLTPFEITEAFRHRIRIKGGRTRIERFNIETEKWEMLPENWKQFKRGSSSYKKRLEDFHQLLLLLNAKTQKAH